MIVISGALVLVALILLIVGVVGPDLTFVYASIGVSLVSLVFLVIGILQRRGDTGTETAAAAPEVAEQPADDVTTVLPSQVGTSRRVTEREPIAESADEELTTGGTVLVVEGRPRYHVGGCRYLSGKQAEEVDVLDAREEGFTPCGVCKPDDALAELEFEDEPDEQDVVEQDVPGVEVPVVRTAAATRAVKAPATKAAVAKKAPAKAPAKAVAPAKAAAPARKAPSKAAVAAVASTPAAAKAAKKPGSVVVIPDRGKFHQAECRYVRGVPGAEVLTRSAATRQGYAACGVCKP